MDVLVAGAGPTGLVLACALRQQGVPVRVVDAAAGPSATSRALVLHARGAQTLDRLDAVGDLPDRAVRLSQIAIHADGAQIAVLPLDARPESCPLIVSQAEVEAALRARLAKLGGEVEWGTALRDAKQDSDGVTVDLSSGEQLRVSWLAGCDGAHSMVRKLADIDFPGVAHPERFLLADVRLDLPVEPHSTAVWLDRAGLLVAFPLAGEPNLWRLVADTHDPDGDDSPEGVLRGLREALAVRGRLAPDIKGEPAWTSAFRVHRRIAARYRNGRMLLAGDAAHIHSPFGGQGMNTGIGDAENLAWKLALVVHGQAEARLLDTYEEERRPVADEVVTMVTAATRVMLGADPLSRLIRDRMAVPLATLPPVRRRAVVRASQLEQTYRRGPLAGPKSESALPGLPKLPGLRALPGVPGLPGSRPRPGDRVPDRECARADGTDTRLYAELRHGWALVNPGSGWLGATRSLLGERVTPLSTGEPTTWLVRPDGHLAWRGRQGGELLRWLRQAMGEGRVVR